MDINIKRLSIIRQYLPLIALLLIYPYGMAIFLQQQLFAVGVIAVIIVSIYFVKRQGSADILKLTRFSYKTVLKIFLGFLALLFWAMIVYHFFPLPANQQSLNSREYVGLALLFFNSYVGLIGPIGEELVFRGLVMRYLSSSSIPYLDVVVSACLFSLAHVLPHGWSISDFIAYCGMGMVYALVFKWSKTIYPSTLLHIIWNSLPFLF